MILSDASIRGRLARLDERRIIVEPHRDDAIQPSSIDVRIGARLRAYRHDRMKRTTTDEDWRDVLLNNARCWWLMPGNAYLATIFEWIKVPDDLACQLHGRSTQARMFVTPHQQGGWIDAGYQGHLTLEITVTLPVELAPLDPIGQLVFHQMDRPAQRPYGHPERRSRYQGDTDPTPAKERPTCNASAAI